MQPERIHQLLGTNDSRPETQEELTNCMKPFVATRYGDCLAGSFPRPGARSECWCFPDYANSLAFEIVEVALREWHRLDPDTFPLADWIDQALWQTPDERRAAKELEDLESERTTFLARLAERQQHLEAKLTEAKQSADAHERRLLTARGDDLVHVVAKCFSDFEFDVTDMDKVYPEGDRREDLQINLEEVPDWIALVEVRSYRGGAQSSDLLRIGRFSKRYLKDTGKDADALWYVVNQFIEDNPGLRSPVLASNEPELAEFANDGGTVIDTADLFRLWMAMEDGRIAAEEARSRLMQAPGRFVFED
jgi:hypothetical protein